jgi:hypothetical protein
MFRLPLRKSNHHRNAIMGIPCCFGLEGGEINKPFSVG